MYLYDHFVLAHIGKFQQFLCQIIHGDFCRPQVHVLLQVSLQEQISKATASAWLYEALQIAFITTHLTSKVCVSQPIII